MLVQIAGDWIDADRVYHLKLKGIELTLTYFINETTSHNMVLSPVSPSEAEDIARRINKARSK